MKYNVLANYDDEYKTYWNMTKNVEIIQRYIVNKMNFKEKNAKNMVENIINTE
jgi:hypothetical protein